MTRDYSQFLPDAPRGTPPEPERSILQDLGWQPFFAQQTSVDETQITPPARVTEVHRNRLQVLGDGIEMLVPPGLQAIVGDWVLLNRDLPTHSRVLDRKSLFKRRAPGTGREVQLIAANIETVFVVSSCNADFNVARLERYIALAFDAQVDPVIVLTKADLCEDPEQYTGPAAEISDRVPVILLDARGDQPAAKLADWCRPGQTLACLGSSGVGKSTLVNALAGAQAVATQAIREDDAKGRHTTTYRQLHVMPGGYCVLDTPGMRELQLTDAQAGVADVFADIVDLAAGCRFADCQHETEPGCAVQAALETGAIDAARLARWRKLAAEDRYNSETLAERRSRDKTFGKMVRQIVKQKKK